ncbi:MAG: acyl-CoA dehydrogenase [Candidatus Thermoplasmatota archaeon]|jgi:butyryl-CoA dehydrogenase|nr:acyl-CoA dehydrogenase [Candidatus Thermoplasmatota archaeon]
MFFELSEQQTMIRNMVRELAEKEIAPKAAELDRNEEFPDEAIKRLAELGILGAIIPEKYGGPGLDTVTYAMMIMEISRACASTGVVTSVHNSLCSWPIMYYGSEEQKDKYLPILARGDRIGAFAATEPDAGSDLGSLSTVAELNGDNYIINGTKTFITSGPRAGIVIVFAVTDRSKGTKGISAFIVESSYKGYKVGSIFEKIGIHASLTSELIFEDMPVPKENLLGKEGDGFKIAMATLDGGRIGIASQAVGIAQAALEESIKYSQARHQFGKPISSFQAIQWMLAEMATKIDAARLLTYQAAIRKDQGARISKEAAMAKLYASETAVEATNNAIQIHGGYGYTREYPVERLYRDARITTIYEGTSEVQKMVIASSLLR